MATLNTTFRPYRVTANNAGTINLHGLGRRGSRRLRGAQGGAKVALPLLGFRISLDRNSRKPLKRMVQKQGKMDSPELKSKEGSLESSNLPFVLKTTGFK